MRGTSWAPLALGAFAAWAVACGANALKDGGDNVPNGGSGGGAAPGGGFSSSGGGSSSSGGGAAACTTAAQCPAGFTCEAGACVRPEVETNTGLSQSPPVATPHYVFALNPSGASVARIDPATLAIEAVAVGPRPIALAAMPGEDAAVVLSADDLSLSLIDSRVLPSKLVRLPLKRQYGRLAISPDGHFAVAWPDGTAPASGAEGVFALVDLVKARAGKPASEVVQELGGGYRLTDVVFRTDAGVTTRLYVFAKSTVSSFDLTTGGSTLPTRLTLPASMSADVSSREVVASDDGHVVMLRSTVSPQLAAYDGVALTTVPLPEVATDLDLLPGGTAAVAALRTRGSVAYLELPQDLVDPTGIQEFPVPGNGVGQVALPPELPAGGMFALVWSNVTGDESLAKVDLPSGVVTRWPLEKRVDEVAVSPDSKSAIIIHRAQPDTTATDPYEAAVDRDQGFSVVDVASGSWQLQRTGTTRPTRFAFSPRGGYVGVALRNDGLQRFALMAVNLTSQVSTTLTLPSAPLFMGTVPEAPGITPHRVFVSQQHPAGRISVTQLDSGQVRTATGFTLNGEIQ
ncbi:MAG: hypothetical protein K1X89_11910 [Myxococcaceae bacterium]|nr:hypothetical protein [Myxococcaceae bacterium]